MYDIVIKLHYVVSTIFLILALITTTWALLGWIREPSLSPVIFKIVLGIHSFPLHTAAYRDYTLLLSSSL